MADSPSDLGAPARWLLLIHQLPPKPASFRVKIWRRLQALGAVAIRGAVYALPEGAQAREDFQWLCAEIAAGGGEAALCEARLLAGIGDEEVRGLFRGASDADYAALRDEALALAAELEGEAAGPATRPADARARLARLRRRFDDIAALDRFQAPGRDPCASALQAVEAGLRRALGEVESRGAAAALAPRGRVWVTRADVRVDRIASAWLIGRFIDPQARFRFVAGDRQRPQPEELRFDMFDAEYTHEGERCTFEVLLARHRPGDRALAAIGEIVHDIDLKDGRFGRPEAPGIARLIEGLARSEPDDGRRLERGGLLFDALHAALRAAEVAGKGA